MRLQEILQVIAEKDPFVIISDPGNFQGNFEITYLDADGLHNASGWGAYVEPIGPYTLEDLKSWNEEDDDEDDDIEGIPLSCAIDAIEKSGAGLKQEVFLAYLGVLGENAELIVGKTRESCMKELQCEIMNCSDLVESLTEMNKQDILEFYGDILQIP